MAAPEYDAVAEQVRAARDRTLADDAQRQAQAERLLEQGEGDVRAGDQRVGE